MKNILICLQVLFTCSSIISQDYNFVILDGKYKTGFDSSALQNIYTDGISSFCTGMDGFTLTGVDHPIEVNNFKQRKNMFVIYSDGTYFDSRNINPNTVWPPNSQNNSTNFKIESPNVNQIKYMYLSNIYNDDDEPGLTQIGHENSDYSVDVTANNLNSFHFNQDFVPGKYVILVIPAVSLSTGNFYDLHFDTSVIRPVPIFLNGTKFSFTQQNLFYNNNSSSINGISKPEQFNFISFRVNPNLSANKMNSTSVVELRNTSSNVIYSTSEVVRQSHDPNMIKVKCISKKLNANGKMKYYALYRIQFLNEGNGVVDSVKFSLKLPKTVQAKHAKLFNWYYSGKRSCKIVPGDITMESKSDNNLVFRFKKGFLLPQDKGAAEFCVPLTKNPEKSVVPLLPLEANVWFDNVKWEIDFHYDPMTKFGIREIQDDCYCRCAKTIIKY